MSKNSAIMLVGILVALMPFLGLPGSWKDTFFVIAGLYLISLSVTYYIRKRANAQAVNEIMSGSGTMHEGANQ